MSDDDRHGAALGQVLELAVLLGNDMAKALARDGLTGSRAHLLYELGQRGPCTQRELAEALRVSARTITGLVDGLAATGFVTRQPHPTDRRAILVTFTDRGIAMVEQMRRGRAEFAEYLFAGMPPERFDGLVGGLADVLDRLRAAGLDNTLEETP